MIKKSGHYCYTLEFLQQTALCATPTSSFYNTFRQYRQRLNRIFDRRRRQEASSNQPREVLAHQLVVHRHIHPLRMGPQHTSRIRIVQVRRLGTGGQVIQHEVEQGIQRVILHLHDVLLELPPPDEVLALFGGEAVLGEGGEHAVECGERPGGDVHDRKGGIG